MQVDWVEARKKEWGEDDPRFVARVTVSSSVSDDGLFNGPRHAVDGFTTPQAGCRLFSIDVALRFRQLSDCVEPGWLHIKIHGRYQGLNGLSLPVRLVSWQSSWGLSEIRIDYCVGASVLDSIYNFVPIKHFCH